LTWVRKPDKVHRSCSIRGSRNVDHFRGAVRESNRVLVEVKLDARKIGAEGTDGSREAEGSVPGNVFYVIRASGGGVETIQ
jgi:hypothetical protein